MELSARYINDRKLPDKAIDVIDETGASQMLLPENKRKRTIGVKEIEHTISTMARIPPKTVSKNDVEVLENIESTLRRVVYGQDAAITQLSAAIKLARAGCATARSPSAATCSPARPASARRKLPSSSRRFSASS